MSVKVEVWGDYALFTRPEMKVERVSYDVPTPSAARGILESIYFHPGMYWHIDKIYVLNPIKFTNIRRNEVKSKILASDIKAFMFGKADSPGSIITGEDIQQRASIMLRDVHYVIEAHFTMTDKANDSDNPGKFQDIMRRRLEKGSCYLQPYLGTRECTAHFKAWDGGDIPTIDADADLGWMLYDMDYSNPADIQPCFFRAQMKHGVIDLSDCEVVR